jgi:hypothetical protein
MNRVLVTVAALAIAASGCGEGSKWVCMGYPKHGTTSQGRVVRDDHS